MSRIPELEVFVEVIEHESFTDAADSLGVSKSFVSKQISRLEDRLGVRLINRTTRQLHLTDAGAAFFDRAKRIVEDIDEAERSVMQLNTRPRGTLRISAPMSFGLEYLSPVLNDFLCDHEELSLDLELSDRNVDLIDEGFDLAVRIANLRDSSFMARKLAPAELMVVASPEYLAKHGRPQKAHDLSDHMCMQYTYQASGTNWRLISPSGQDVSVPITGRIKANNGNVLRDAAVRGVGLAILPDFICTRDVAEGRLVRVLEDWSMGTRAIWAIYPHSRHLSAKVRACVD